MTDTEKSRYSLKYTFPNDTMPVWYESLGGVFLALEDGLERFCEVVSEDGLNRYVGRVSLVKANIAWKLLNIKYDGNPPTTSDRKIIKDLEKDLKNKQVDSNEE